MSSLGLGQPYNNISSPSNNPDRNRSLLPVSCKIFCPYVILKHFRMNVDNCKTFLGVWSKTLNLSKDDIIANKTPAQGRVTNGFLFELRYLMPDVIKSDLDCARKLKQMEPCLKPVSEAKIAKRVHFICSSIKKYLRRRDRFVDVYFAETFDLIRSLSLQNKMKTYVDAMSLNESNTIELSGGSSSEASPSDSDTSAHESDKESVQITRIQRKSRTQSRLLKKYSGKSTLNSYRRFLGTRDKALTNFRCVHGPTKKLKLKDQSKDTLSTDVDIQPIKEELDTVEENVTALQKLADKPGKHAQLFLCSIVQRA